MKLVDRSLCAAAWVFMSLFAVSAPATATVSASDAVSKVLDRLHASAAKSDAKTYFGLYTPDAIFIGTDVDERWTIRQFRDYAGPLFAKGQGWVYTVRQRHISFPKIPCRCVAVFDEVLDSQKYGTSRGTGTMIATPTGWKIDQYALTFPMPNELAGDFTKRIREYEKKAESN